MFGWKVKTETPSAQSNIIDRLNLVLSKVDAAITNTTAQTLANLQNEANACNQAVSQLTPTEQSKVSMFWTSGVMAMLSTFDMYNAMPAMKITMAKSLLPNIKTHILNTINALS